jgi:hypothetical protein
LPSSKLVRHKIGKALAHFNRRLREKTGTLAKANGLPNEPLAARQPTVPIQTLCNALELFAEFIPQILGQKEPYAAIYPGKFCLCPLSAQRVSIEFRGFGKIRLQWGKNVVKFQEGGMALAIAPQDGKGALKIRAPR